MAKVVFNLTLKQYVPEKEVGISLNKPVPLFEFLRSRQVPEDDVGLVVRNGRWEAKGDCVIHDDDHIELFPFLQGR
jgi:hypothetical protein